MTKNEYGRVRQVGSKYPNGYWDKITYWAHQLNQFIKE